MFDINKELCNKNIKDKNIVLYWVGGTGYIIKSKRITVGLDLYLSDSCRKKNNEFKRIIPEFINPEELELDYLIATHDHGDHFDHASVKYIINNNNPTKLIGPGSVLKAAEELNISNSKLIRLDRGQSIKLSGMCLKGVLADHGDYSPDCIGVIIKINNKNIYFTSDTRYRYDLPELVSIKDKIDILIVPINGKYGNPDSKDAAYITSWVKPKIVIPSHFWMFAEHGGDPGEFALLCPKIAPGVKIIIPAIGEELIF